MAQKATAKEQAVAPATGMYDGFSPEEIAELLGATGQVHAMRGEKIPQIKVNYCDIEDREGRTIKKGNFVIGQNTSEVEVEVEVDGEREMETRVEDIGIDLGKTPKITVLAFGQQYSFYHADPKKRCSSQITIDNDEIPAGNNLKHQCRAKTCPRRAEGIDRKDKCSCQFIVYCLVKHPETGESMKAIMYLKGTSFMPFSDYVNYANKQKPPVALFMCPTKLTNKMEKEGSVTYFVVTPELLLDQRYDILDIRAHRELAEETRKTAREVREQQRIKNQKRLPASSGTTATVVDDEITDVEFD